VRRQSENFPDYQAAITKLEADGLIYPSFESRNEINALVAEHELRGSWPRDPDGAPLYPGTGRTMSSAERERRRRAGEPFALRIAMDAALARAGPLSWTETGSGPQGQSGCIAAAPQMWGDVVLARKELPTSYHLAVVVDDALQGVTDVVRGQDLFWTTGIHRLLQTLLELPEPVYHHHRLILDTDGRKLSKTSQATSLRELHAAGASAADIRSMVGL
jgi:glutamyl-Q tRNA(Asp) synthetase